VKKKTLAPVKEEPLSKGTARTRNPSLKIEYHVVIGLTPLKRRF
jgi:hypothetical protein